MPTYVYRCRDCRKTVEVIQRFTDDPLTICPHCGGTLQRVLFPPAIIFKGSGWYSTDHKSPSGNALAKSEATAKAGGNGSDAEAPKPAETTADSKSKSPAASPDRTAAGSSDRAATRTQEKGSS